MSRAFLRHPTTSNFLRRSRTVSTKTSSTDPVEQNLRRDLAIAHRLIAHHGMDELHWNHISARDQSWGKGKYLVTPGDKHFACIEPADLVLMGSTTGKQLENVTADGRFNRFLDPNATAIEHVLTFHLLYRYFLYRRLLYLHLLYRHWIIPTSTRPSLDLRSPSAV